MGISQHDPVATGRPAWNAGKRVGAKRALKARQIWSIRFFLDREGRMRDRALFDLAIASKLREFELVEIKIGTLVGEPTIRARSMVVQQKTGRPVQFEITADVRGSLLAWADVAMRANAAATRNPCMRASDLVVGRIPIVIRPRAECDPMFS